MPQITFLHQERLRKEMRDFLLECGYSESEVGLIDKLPVMNVGTKDEDRDYMRFYTRELKEKVLRQDALLFSVFPEYLEAA